MAQAIEHRSSFDASAQTLSFVLSIVVIPL